MSIVKSADNTADLTHLSIQIECIVSIFSNNISDAWASCNKEENDFLGIGSKDFIQFVIFQFT